MRRTLFAANWKMHLTPNAARELIAALRAKLDPDAALFAQREVLIAAPAPLLFAAAQALAGSRFILGAQNMYFEDAGAFTGEVSPVMLRALGAGAVILGHSERRHVFHESDGLIGRKVKAALRHRMMPILCVGETQQQHDAGGAIAVVRAQLEAALSGLDAAEVQPLVLAYEPVWAIGTGRNATPEQAEEVHGALRSRIAQLCGEQAAASLRILYGGSVTPDNVDSLLSKPDIDGALVGGASLKADSFVRIVRSRTR